MDDNIIQGSGTATGTDTYAVSLSVGVTEYVTNGIYEIDVANANLTETPTVNINGIGAINLKDKEGSTIRVGDLSGRVLIIYDGTNFRNLVAPLHPWKDASFVFGDFTAAALTTTITAYTRADGEDFTGLRVIPTISFAGTGITKVTISLGRTGETQKYMAIFDIDQTTNQAYETEFDKDLFDTTDDIEATITAVGANLDQLSAGAITFKFKTSQS